MTDVSEANTIGEIELRHHDLEAHVVATGQREDHQISASGEGHQIDIHGADLPETDTEEAESPVIDQPQGVRP